MNATQYLAWARTLLPSRGRSRAARYFLTLPSLLEAAGGEGHFLETAAGSRRGLERLKLALILVDPLERLLADPKRGDDPRKAGALLGIVEELNRGHGGGYDLASARLAVELLRRWRLRGSLMAGCDFDRDSGSFGKVSLYAYLSGPGALPELLEPLGLSALAGRLAPLAPGLGFWGLDLPPGGGWSLKFYNRAPYLPEGLPEGLRQEAERVAAIETPRDVTRLTRVAPLLVAPPRGEGTGVRQDKVYLGFKEGIDLAALSRSGAFAAHRGFLQALAAQAPGQRAYFLGWNGVEVEVYFDRRKRESEDEEAAGASPSARTDRAEAGAGRPLPGGP